MFPDELNHLAQQLQQLRQADRNLRVFGASKHRYQLQRTLTENEIAEFEHTRGCRLPADYRAWVQQIGDGDAGPYYGLNPLHQAAAKRDLSQPFPFTGATDFYGGENDEPQIDAYDDFPGIIELCEMGCATYCYLVVNGPAFGTVWYNDENFHPTRKSFFDWYQQWLERALRLCERQDMAQKIQIGMSKARALAVLGGDWSERPSLIEPKTILSSSQFPFTVEFDTMEKIIAIKDWPFI